MLKDILNTSARLGYKLKTGSRKRKKSELILKFQTWAARKMLLFSSAIGNTKRAMSEGRGV